MKALFREIIAVCCSRALQCARLTRSSANTLTFITAVVQFYEATSSPNDSLL